MPLAAPMTHPGLMTLPPPPPILPGWRVAPPDFVGVGVMKAGTTWWWTVLNSHPRVVNGYGTVAVTSATEDNESLDRLYSTKELHFFDRYGEVTDIDPAVYHRYFPRPPGAIAGEWTPRYLCDFWTPPMLRAVAPDARILVLLRDPVERYLSGLAHIIAKGYQQDPTLAFEHLCRGFYWQQLQTLLASFDRDRVLILQYERCVADPEHEARRTFAFLGLDSDEWRYPPELTRPVGIVNAKMEISANTRRALCHAYRADLTRLLADFPELDGDLWPTAIS